MVKSVHLPTGVTLEYVEHGGPSGLRIVCLHGVGDSWRSFEPVLPYLPCSLHTFVPSQRGQGNSGRPATGYRVADLSADLLAFMDALAIPVALIVGHAVGANVAMRFAIDHPERTLGLVLAGASAAPRDNAAVRGLWDSAVSTMFDPVNPNFVRDFQMSTLAQPAPALLESIVEESMDVPARVWRGTFADLRELDFSRELERIRVPTYVSWGSRDAFVSLREQQALTAAIQRARLLLYPGAGHRLHWENPARFAAHVIAFAREILSRAGRRADPERWPATA
jgi:pimeloyl-ACP methyl ester carboxylesterase